MRFPETGNLRELTAEDLDAVQALFERCGDYFLLHEGRRPGATEARDEWHARPPETPRANKHLIGLSAPELVGVLEVVCDWPRPATWNVGLLLLEPAARRRAAGSRMMAAVDRWAAQVGADTLRISVNTANTGGMAFWRRLGFKQVAAVGADPAVIALERPVSG
jgi:GNAT superfamily N-acetyltransferase